MAATEPLPFVGRVGAPASPEELAIVREATGKIIHILNAAGEYGPTVLASAMLSAFMAQSDPVEKFNFVTLQVAAAIRNFLATPEGNA